ncbi:DUF3470 domain-containing protein [Maritimibacter sp. DP07]|uniref:Ferredoxin n=1 Tax=Maritimibacter harenae TaxID=2606218 RepID=A0A845M3A9_9RHOB|nr:DUF3470 domain-containing protein [Maritimibacter harenae]
MTYIVNDNCIAFKHTDCVTVCPVDSFYEGESMLVNHPDECIDCGVCEPECPVDAIRPDSDPEAKDWVGFNRKYAKLWPIVIEQKPPLPGPDEMDGAVGKLETHFSEKPGGISEGQGRTMSLLVPISLITACTSACQSRIGAASATRQGI